MSRKIFTAIWGAALAVFAASLVFIMGVSYNYFTGVQMKQLHAETALAAQGVSLCGKDYFTGLSTGDYRVTWIDADGTVLFDTGADASRMENHLEREEIRQALQNGTGEARRYSPTLADRQLYAAQRLPDGTVLRLSVVQLALWSLVLGFAQPICLVALLALGLSFLLASQLTKKIVAPINAIDPDNPMQYYEKDEYREVEPLLRRIAAQQAQLRRDRAEIERASLIRQEFTANVSHELKTPLHAISGYAELLESGLAKPEDVKPFAGKIRTESGRMTKLVEDIIDLTRLDAGGEDYVFESCDLLRIAENAVDSLETEASGALSQGRERADAGRAAASPQHHLQSLRQRHQVQSPRRARRYHRHAGGRRGRPHRERHRRRHPEGQPEPHFRAVLPRGQEPLQGRRRHGARPLHREARRAHPEGGRAR